VERLFFSFQIKKIEFKNRIVMPSLASFFTEDGGRKTGLPVEHYLSRTAGGPAMVMMEACAVSPKGIVSPNQTRIYDDLHIEGIQDLVRKFGEAAVRAKQAGYKLIETQSVVPAIGIPKRKPK